MTLSEDEYSILRHSMNMAISWHNSLETKYDRIQEKRIRALREKIFPGYQSKEDIVFKQARTVLLQDFLKQAEMEK